jgi:hypothetical protein
MSESRYYVQGEQLDDGRYWYVVDRIESTNLGWNREAVVSKYYKRRAQAEREADRLELESQKIDRSKP